MTVQFFQDNIDFPLFTKKELQDTLIKTYDDYLTIFFM